MVFSQDEISMSLSVNAFKLIIFKLIIHNILNHFEVR